ncbi:MAG: phage virion morphogenesis protein [Flavipsychrobacter sp.]
MPNPLDPKLKEIEKRLKDVLHKAPRAVGTMAASHFRDNFRKQGFDDKTVELWKGRKYNKKGDADRAILTKTGRLARSVRLRSYNTERVVIGTNVPYARFHNEGGIMYRRPHGRKTGLTRNYNGKSYSVKKQVRGTSYKLTRRRFIGPSESLNRKIDRWYKLNINRALKRK